MALVAHWLLNETSGTAAADNTGNGHAGTLTGCTWVASGLGGAIELDGVDDIITVADHANLSLTGDVSIALWLKSTSSKQDWMRVLGKGTCDLRTYGLWVEHETNYLLFQQYDGANGYNIQLRHVIAGNTWHHVVATVGGTSCKLYVGNSVVASGTRTGTPSAPAEPLLFGHCDGAWSSYFAGRLDDVRIYNHELSAAEVNTIFTAGSP